MIELGGIICAIIIIGRLLFNWFDGNSALPSKKWLARHRKWPN